MSSKGHATEPPTLALRAIALALKQDRLRAGLGIPQAAHLADCDRSTINRLEAGGMAPRLITLKALCRVYGVSENRTAYLLGLRLKARDRGLSEEYAEVHPDWRLLHDAETMARTVFAWEPEYIHGLLQTPEYLAVLRKYSLPTTDAEAEEVLRIRMKRQSDVMRVRPEARSAKMRFLMGEAALRYLRPWPEMQAGQYRRLFELDVRPNIEIRVVCGLHASMMGAYEGLGFGPSSDDLPPLVCIEGVDVVRYVEEDDLVSRYERAFTMAFDSATRLKEYVDDHSSGSLAEVE